MIRNFLRPAFIALMAGVIAPGHAQILTLVQAEELAVERDPTIAALREQAKSVAESAVADGELPDPKLKFGLVNFPTDSFSRTQEPVTQIQLGAQQTFPPGRSLRYARERGERLSQAETARAEDRRLIVLRDLRISWYETYYWARAAQIVSESRGLFEHLVRITRRRYAAGGQNQQDVFRSELELELLQDRISQVHTNEDKARADLAQWIGHEAAARSLPLDMAGAATVADRADLLASLEAHPAVAVEDARVAARRLSIKTAHEAYKPRWTVDVTYGARDGSNIDGSQRADFLSAMVLVDVPIRPGRRQDRRLAADHHAANAAVDTRAATLRRLRAMFDDSYASWRRLNERVQRYDENLLELADANVEAAFNAYQNDRGDFTQLIRARISALETRLNALRLRVDRAQSAARLDYLAGGAS